MAQSITLPPLACHLSTVHPGAITSHNASRCHHFPQCILVPSLPTVHPGAITSHSASWCHHFPQCILVPSLPTVHPGTITSHSASWYHHFPQCILVPSLSQVSVQRDSSRLLCPSRPSYGSMSLRHPTSCRRFVFACHLIDPDHDVALFHLIMFWLISVYVCMCVCVGVCVYIYIFK
ncbi:hypothetical protein DPEC_G00357170 [Dallia pectoralis]|uniref:Uncharacterized protein n=1 Tax=Dallia pectoralis TaxID=75939 RepID=A0ACC2F003_DALPE|nr:hypothetical protein DPEC_G00357170 [Dallia pectoralis]